MKEIIFYLFIGLGIGSLYAMLGAGLVVVYKGSGVINFAHGRDGHVRHVHVRPSAGTGASCFLPWVDFLPTHSLNVPVRSRSDSGGVPMAVAFVIALVMAALLGLGAHFLVFRPLRNAAPLGKVVASLGLALYLQGVALLNFGTSSPTAEDRFPDDESLDNFLGLGNPFPRNSSLRRLRHRDGRRHALGGVQVHPLRPGDPGRRRQREGRRAAGLLAAAARRRQLGRRLDHSPRWPPSSSGRSRARSPRSGSRRSSCRRSAAALIGGLQSVPITIGRWPGARAWPTRCSAKKSSTGSSCTRIERGDRDVIPLLVIVVVLFLRGKSLPCGARSRRSGCRCRRPRSGSASTRSCG